MTWPERKIELVAENIRLKRQFSERGEDLVILRITMKNESVRNSVSFQ